ncbi:MAG TPA: tetratricopeptide repeat protein [Burkholderiales bacterium]|nr:tetratricopeptide repeat protein [Burkholderiales bacterium]
MNSALRAAAFLLAPIALAAPPLEHPDPEDFEPGVRDALVEGLAAFESARAGASDTELAAAYGELGRLYLAHHLTHAAEGVLANAAALAPQTFEWRYLLGYARQQQGKPDEAAADYARALELEPDHVAVVLRLGEAQFAAGRLEDAQQSFLAALERRPRSAAALAGLGRIALRRRDYPAAVRAFEQALAAEPQANGLNYPLAMAYRQMGQRERAQVLLERRGERDPVIDDPLLAGMAAQSASVQYHLESGYAALRSDAPRAAVEAFRQAVAVSPGDVSARLSLAQALAAAGDAGAAMTEIDAALELEPESAPAHYRKGSLFEQGGDPDAALSHYRRAVALDPGYAQARLLLAYALMRRHEFAAAAEQFAEISERQPGAAIVRYRLGLAHLGAGDCARAHGPLEEARQLNPRSGEILDALARAYASCASSTDAQRATALEAARLLYEARPRPEQAATLAMALAASGHFAEAAELQSGALEAARAEARPDDVAALEEDLALYRAGRPASRAWRPGASVFDPPRLAADADGR